MVNHYLQEWTGQQFDITSADGDLSDPSIVITIDNTAGENFDLVVTWDLMGETMGEATSASAIAGYSIWLCNDSVAVAEGSGVLEAYDGEGFHDLSGRTYRIRGEKLVQIDLRPTALASASGGYGNPGGTAEVLGDIRVEILPVIGN